MSNVKFLKHKRGWSDEIEMGVPTHHDNFWLFPMVALMFPIKDIFAKTAQVLCTFAVSQLQSFRLANLLCSLA